jgi:hypothetical protein
LSKKDYLIARDGEVLTGIVMPVRYGPYPQDMLLEAPTDVEVFHAFAAKENEWYLATKKHLNSEFCRITSDLEIIREKIGELEDERDALEADRDSIEKRLDALGTANEQPPEATQHAGGK